MASRQAGYFSASQALEAGYSYPAQHYNALTQNWLPDPDGHGYLGRDSWMRRKARFEGVSSAFAWASSYTENQ